MSKIIKLRHHPDVELDATVDVYTGRPLVEFRFPTILLADDVLMTPREARTLSKALAEYADRADAKRCAS